MLEALIAALALVLACGVWFAVQRWANDDEIDGTERCGKCTCGGGGACQGAADTEAK